MAGEPRNPHSLRAADQTRRDRWHTGSGRENAPAFDDVIQAACGLASINSEGRDAPEYVPSLVADKTVGMALVNAVLAGLYSRERTGRGQYAEVPMLETMVAFVLAEHLGGLTFDPPPSGAGYARLLAGGRKPAPTLDGHIAMLPYTGAHWAAFFRAAGREDLAEKYGVADRAARNANIVSMYADMAAMTRLRTTAEWMRICVELDIPATPIYSLDELPDHPHLKAVGLFRAAVHPSEGPVRYVAPPTKFSGTPAAIRRHAPLHGEHTDEILLEAGYTKAEVQALSTRRVVVCK